MLSGTRIRPGSITPPRTGASAGSGTSRRPRSRCGRTRPTRPPRHSTGHRDDGVGRLRELCPVPRQEPSPVPVHHPCSPARDESSSRAVRRCGSTMSGRRSSSDGQSTCLVNRGSRVRIPSPALSWRGVQERRCCPPGRLRARTRVEHPKAIGIEPPWRSCSRSPREADRPGNMQSEPVGTCRRRRPAPPRRRARGRPRRLMTSATRSRRRPRGRARAGRPRRGRRRTRASSGLRGSGGGTRSPRSRPRTP